MLSANFKPKRIAAASRGFLAIARLSCTKYEVTVDEIKSFIILVEKCHRFTPVE